ncbi:hypothetical protein [Nonomuraea africana]|uniref:Uncharacterized protein n=1 Tax=Nonomuraea africana TaxID=46171 RepID=A0ABR9KV47_9ACTN|nr:hypothetical protein [Nonomuraea africana]MBE1565616.1 hypothetical protein [Nonomuraea africana]
MSFPSGRASRSRARRSWSSGAALTSTRASGTMKPGALPPGHQNFDWVAPKREK